MQDQPKSPFFKKIFSNPITIISISLNILGLIWAVFMYAESRSKRELTSYLYPAKAVIYKSGQISTLDILFNNKKILSDVTALQIALWNKGKRAIESNDILKEIKILTEPKTSLLDAEIRKVSRDVIDLRIDKNHFEEGYVPVSWKILEKNDGGIIQLILSGGVEVKVFIEGIIKEPCSIIRNIDLSTKIKGALEQIKTESQGSRALGYSFLFFAILNLILIVTSIRKFKKFVRFLIFMILITIAAAAFAVYNFLSVKSIGPPFGF